MRVGLDLLFLGERSGGVGRYAEELLGALATHHADVELHAFVGPDVPARLQAAPWAERVRFTTVPLRAGRLPLELLATYAGLPALALARRLDVLHGPANVGATRVPRLGCVVTLHDLIWLHLGEQWGPAAAVRAMRRQAGPAARHADAVLADSEHAAGQVVAGLGADSRRLHVAPLGVRPPAAAPPRAPDGERPLLLCVAQLRPYKRQDLLVRALADPRLRHARLVLPGAPTGWSRELRALADELGVGDRLETPGYVADAELEQLYAAATAVLLPSEHEGFGLPVLEAMARSVPVACSDRGSLPEVAGDAADVLDLDAPGQVADVLARLTTDPDHRDELTRRGREHAAAFTWRRTAEGTVEAYAAAAARARGGRRR